MLSTLRRQLCSGQTLTFARALSTSPAASHGGLEDKDRIFTNIYGVHDKFIDGAMKRGDWYRCARWSRPVHVAQLPARFVPGLLCFVHPFINTSLQHHLCSIAVRWVPVSSGLLALQDQRFATEGS